MFAVIHVQFCWAKVAGCLVSLNIWNDCLLFSVPCIFTSTDIEFSIYCIYSTRGDPIISLKVLYKGLGHHEHPRFYCHHGSFSHRNRHRYQYRACHPAYHTWQPPTHPTLAGGMSPCWCGPSCRCGRCIHEEPPPVAYTSLTMPAIMPAQPVVSPFTVS